jgi:6-phosphogluconolactonase
MLDLADLAGQRTGRYACAATTARRFSVPGGTTPGPVFDVLSEQALDWDRVRWC